jgi:uncharacterized protein YbjT (DUF2867 family)
VSVPYTVTIFGATGKTGRLVLEQTVARGWRARVATRRPPPVGDWTRFEWDERAGWADAFRGSNAAYLLIPFKHPGAPETMPLLLETAANAGVGRIVLLSSLDAEHAEADDPLRRAEDTLQQLDVRHTILRPTWFFDNFSVGTFASMTEAGELRLPAGDGAIPFVDVRDVAAVATEALSKTGPEGLLALTGPEAIDHGELAAALSAALGRRISYSPVPDDEFITLMLDRGFGYDYARFLAQALRDVAEGRVAVPVSGTVERVCGRRAYDPNDFATNYARSLSH